MKYSLVAMARPEMMTFGGANARAALTAAGGALQKQRHRASRLRGAVGLAVAHQRFRFDQHRRLRGDVGKPRVAAAGRANHEIAEVRTEPVCAAKQFAVVKNAKAQAALDVDDQKVVQVARLSEPVFGQRHQIDVAVDRSGHAEAMGEIVAERNIALLKNRALAANARGAFDDAR